MKYIRTNNHFYKQYCSGKKVRISKQKYLNHQPKMEIDTTYDSEGDVIMKEPKLKSILKTTRKGTITEVWSDKQVRFGDLTIVRYYLSQEEKEMKIKVYRQIKGNNRVYNV